VQMQQQELQLKSQDHALNEKKLMADTAAKADQLEVERERIASQERIAGLQVGAKTAADKAKLAASQRSEGVRMGIDVARELSNKEQGRLNGGK